MDKYTCYYCDGKGKIYISGVEGNYTQACRRCGGMGKTMVKITLEEYETLKNKRKPKDELNCRICTFRYMTKESLDKLGLDPCLSCKDASNWRPIEDDEWTLRG